MDEIKQEAEQTYKPVNPIFKGDLKMDTKQEQAYESVTTVEEKQKMLRNTTMLISKAHHDMLRREKEKTGYPIRVLVEKMIMEHYGRRSAKLEVEINKRAVEKLKQEISVKYRKSYNDNMHAIKERNAKIVKLKARIAELEAKVKTLANTKKSINEAGADRQPDRTQEAGKPTDYGESTVLQSAQDTNQGQPTIHNTDNK